MCKNHSMWIWSIQTTFLQSCKYLQSMFDVVHSRCKKYKATLHDGVTVGSVSRNITIAITKKVKIVIKVHVFQIYIFYSKRFDTIKFNNKIYRARILVQVTAVLTTTLGPRPLGKSDTPANARHQPNAAVIGSMPPDNHETFALCWFNVGPTS